VVPKFSETPGSVDFLGCAMGAHNDEIYRKELGYSDEKIDQLKAEKII
jgi:crotonobetainyl-CoA:carnitine CoA-transferase CaiB-like acyl-CoA transferase